MTGLDLRVQNFLKFFLAFLGASTDDLRTVQNLRDLAARRPFQ